MEGADAVEDEGVNLDDEEINDLKKWEERFKEKPRETNAKLFPSRHNKKLPYEDAMRLLGRYAEASWRAKENRLAGTINVAQFWEDKMEVIYRQLPSWAKW